MPPGAQSPLVVLQTSLEFSHCALEVHFPHSPAIEPMVKQNGAVEVGQASVAVDSLSPLHRTQVMDLPSQTGVMPVHCDELWHCTQVWVVVSQIGVVPEHCEFITHPTQTMLVGSQIVDRQTVGPLVALHGPSPLA